MDGWVGAQAQWTQGATGAVLQPPAEPSPPAPPPPHTHTSRR